MSLRRISRPGMPTLLLDDGPAAHVRRYVQGTGGQIGGLYVVAESPRARELRMQREAMARQREKA